MSVGGDSRVFCFSVCLLREGCGGVGKITKIKMGMKDGGRGVLSARHTHAVVRALRALTEYPLEEISVIKAPR